MTAKAIAKTLGTSGLCICPDFLSRRALHRTVDDLDAIRASGLFRAAGVGRGGENPANAQVRNDGTYWLDRDVQNSVQTGLWRKIDSLQRAFNRSLFLGITEFEGHYAAYPEQGFYRRHRDTFRGDSSRIISFILYLNRNWQPADGGCLRVYSKDLAGESVHRDVNPVGGTMVCFLSEATDHEVLLSRRQRFSLCGWFKMRRGAH